MAYTKVNWTSSTPINTTNLNKMDNAIEQHFNDVDESFDNANTNIENISNKIGNLENLNTTEKANLVGAINEVNTKNIITIKPSGDVTLTNTGWAKLNLPTEYSRLGTKLTLNNGAIAIGSGVSYVKVSASAGVKSTANNVAFGMKIVKNSDEVLMNFHTFSAANLQTEVSLPTFLLPVSEGDIISMQTINQASLFGARTYMTVEVVK